MIHKHEYYDVFCDGCDRKARMKLVTGLPKGWYHLYHEVTYCPMHKEYEGWPVGRGVPLTNDWGPKIGA